MAVKPPRGVLLSKAEADRLAKLYMKAELEIVKEINQALERRNDVRYLKALLENVRRIQADLLAGTRTWSEQAVPRLYKQGMREAEEQLQRAGLKVSFGFGAVHQQAVQVLAENSYRRLADVVQVIGRRVEDLYRETALEATRQSIVGYKSWGEVARDIRKRLEERGITAFKDARNRTWDLSTYSEMVARTTTAEAHWEGTSNRLLESGHDLVRISSHSSSCEKCQPWEGKIISLTGKTPGYPTMREAIDAGFRHPQCRHTWYWELEFEELEKAAGEADALKQGPHSGIIADKRRMEHIGSMPTGIFESLATEYGISNKRVHISQETRDHIVAKHRELERVDVDRLVLDILQNAELMQRNEREDTIRILARNQDLGFPVEAYSPRKWMALVLRLATRHESNFVKSLYPRDKPKRGDIIWSRKAR